VPFPGQFVEGALFLHEPKIAHLDLNETCELRRMLNIVVNVDRDHPLQLLIIDFGLAIFVKDEQSTIEGYQLSRDSGDWAMGCA
jgi:hypothetical protein